MIVLMDKYDEQKSKMINHISKWYYIIIFFDFFCLIKNIIKSIKNYVRSKCQLMKSRMKGSIKEKDKSVSEKAWKRFLDFSSSYPSLSAFLPYYLNSLYIDRMNQKKKKEEDNKKRKCGQNQALLHSIRL